MNKRLILLFFIFINPIWGQSKWSELWSGSHQSIINCVAFSPDSSMIASASNDNLVKVWNTNKGVLLFTLHHSNWIKIVKFSYDGHYIVTGSRDKTIKVWNAANGQLLWTGNHNDQISSLAISNNNKFIVSGSNDNLLKVWDLSKGTLIWTGSHSSIVTSVEFSRDDSKIVSTGNDKKVKVWDVISGKLIWEREHTNAVNILAVNKIYDKVATASIDGILSVWNLNTGYKYWEGKHSGYIYTLEFSHNGNILISGGDDYKIKVWNAESGTLIWFNTHSASIHASSISNDDSKIVTGSWDKTIKIWELNSGNLLFNGKLTSFVETVKFNNTGDIIATGSDDGILRLWTSKLIIELISPKGGELYYTNTDIILSWKTINVDFINLEYSTDNGENWYLIVSNYASSIGSYTWTTNKISNQYKIRISASNNPSVYDMNDSTFFVVSNKNIILIFPNGGEIFRAGSQQQIQWSSSNITNIKIEYTTDNGSSWSLIANNIPANSGSLIWTVPNLSSSNCRIKISDTDDPSIFDISDNVFTILSKSITVLSPNGGENWITGSQQSIRWNSLNVIGLKIEYSTNDGLSWSLIANNIP
ncbi:MAG: WD40 repeat domain-containing protein, partial [Candidatus Pacearchaeota archaeon]